jgi:hypothetical protein
MSAQRRDRDDHSVLASGLPAFDGPLPLLAAGKKNMDRHDEREAVKANVHFPISDFIFGDFPKVTRQICHTLTPRPIDSPNLGKTGEIIHFGKALTATAHRPVNAAGRQPTFPEMVNA